MTTASNLRDILARKRAERAEPPVIAGRPPPHDLNAEAAVLVACIARTKFDSAAVIDRVIGVLGELGAEAFYNQLSAQLWTAIVDLHESRRGVDVVTVASRMRELETFSDTMERHLVDITTNTPALLERMVVEHARIVVRKARMRRVIASLQEWAARGYGDVADDGEFMRDAAHAVNEAARETGAVEEASTAYEAEDALRVELVERRATQEAGNAAGYTTGIPSWDAMTGGLFPRGVTFLSGPEKGRKSTVATWVAVSVAESTERVIMNGIESEQHRGVVVFPFEMSKTEVQLVASCQRGNVDSKLFSVGGATALDYAAREHGANQFVHLPILFDDRPGLSIATLRQRLREARSKLSRGLPGRKRKRADGTWEVLPALPPSSLRLVVIDTFQLFAAQTPHRPADLQSIVDQAGKELKVMAGKDPELARVSWLIVSHENKEGDLRDSGALKNHLTQWIKLSVEENESPYSDRDQLVARFRVHRWRWGEPGAEASAWLNRKTGALT